MSILEKQIFMKHSWNDEDKDSRSTRREVRRTRNDLGSSLSMDLTDHQRVLKIVLNCNAVQSCRSTKASEELIYLHF
jgi:hypothetical protein